MISEMIIPQCKVISGMAISQQIQFDQDGPLLPKVFSYHNVKGTKSPINDEYAPV